jgi:DNA-directed RNA polymerase specialized sigma24 family protein
MLPSEEAAAYRACIDDASRTRARERLAAAVRAYARQRIDTCLRGRDGIGSSDIDDAVQLLTVRLTKRIVASEIQQGGEDSYVFRAASNAATDILRGRMDTRRHEVPHEHGVIDTFASDDPFTRRLQAAESDARLTTIRSLLDRAPAPYRDVITRHHLEGEPLESIIAAELAQRRESASDPEARARAENVVHQRLSRAKRWLRKQLAEADDAG